MTLVRRFMRELGRSHEKGQEVPRRHLKNASPLAAPVQRVTGGNPKYILNDGVERSTRIDD